jgi:hypothetical protein
MQYTPRYPSLRGHARMCMLILLGLDFSDAPAPEALCFGCTVSDIMEKKSLDGDFSTAVAWLILELSEIISMVHGHEHISDDMSNDMFEAIAQMRRNVWDSLDDIVEAWGDNPLPPEI